jgi:hypothetical protein
VIATFPLQRWSRSRRPQTSTPSSRLSLRRARFASLKTVSRRRSGAWAPPESRKRISSRLSVPSADVANSPFCPSFSLSLGR